jgi:hypothetical protein
MDSSNYYWWKVKKSEVHEAVFSLLKKLDQDQSYRRNDNYKHMRLYGNFDFVNLKMYQYFKAEPSASVQNRVTLNVVQSMIDTVVSKVTKNKPKPMFLTDGGDWSMQKRAQKLTQFVEGQFQMTEFYAKSAVAFLDSCIFGTGCLKVFRDGSDIKVERVFIDEIKVDDQESVYGHPRQMHQTKFIHKDVLKEMFPGNDAAIDAASNSDISPLNTTMQATSDMIMVVESWRLPSKKDATDGKHAISIGNHTLWTEPYTKSYFPFVFFRWSLRPLGFFGQGLAEQLSGIQLEINKILRTIQVSMHLVSVPKIFVEAGSKVVAQHLDNKIGGIIYYNGQPPVEGKLGTIPPELFSHLDRLYQRAFEIAGVSQLSATAAKPAGLNSGKALRVYNDMETERFMSVMQRYEQAFLDAAKIMIDLAKEIYEENPEYQVRVKGKKFFDSIKWSDINLDADQYLMSVFPVSALSMNPAARLQDVQELLQAGFIGQDEALKLLDFPDLQSFYNLRNAPAEDIDRIIEQFIERGEYETPEPYQNLGLGIKKMQEAYLLFRSKGADEERLELFRRWIEDAQTLITKAQQQVQAAQAAVQAPEPAATAPEAAMAPEPVAAPEGVPEENM